jgi:hypothetical protein
MGAFILSRREDAENREKQQARSACRPPGGVHPLPNGQQLPRLEVSDGRHAEHACYYARVALYTVLCKIPV